VKALGLDLGQFISQAVNFILFAMILSAALVKPIMRKLEERSQRIRKGLQDAAEAERTLQRANGQAADALDGAQREAREIIETATRAAEQQRLEIVANARQEAYNLMQRAQEQIEHDRIELQTRLHEEMITLSLAIASRLLEAELDDAQHRRLVEQFLVEMQHMPQERSQER